MPETEGVRPSKIFPELVVYGDVDEMRCDDAERLGPELLAAWRELGIEDPIDARQLDYWCIGPDIYARGQAEGLTAQQIIDRWGGP